MNFTPGSWNTHTASWSLQLETKSLCYSSSFESASLPLVSYDSPVSVSKLEWTHHSKPSPLLCSLIPECQLRWGENIAMFDFPKGCCKLLGCMQRMHAQLLGRISADFCYCLVIVILVLHKHEACLSRQTAILGEAAFSWMRGC